MEMTMNFKSAVEMVKLMGKAELSAFVDVVMDMMASAPAGKQEERKDLCVDLGITDLKERPDCPHCAAKANLGYIIKRGKNRGAQRYYCKSCGKYFLATTNTAFAYTRKNAETWKKFIQMTLLQKSLKECEEACGISHLTAFTWRHKIMNVFVVNQEATQMSGNVEADEMQLPISFKGNHMKGRFGRRTRSPGEPNNLPRESFERGSDNKSRFPRDKACVFCMVQDGDRGFYAAVPGVGFMNESMLNATLAKHVKKDTTLMLVDDYHVTKKYLENNGYQHLALKSNISSNPKDHKVEVKNGLHLQHANNMHQQIRRFLKPYYGVSSKYLANYVAMFTWLKTIDITKHRKTAGQISISRAAASDCYIPFRDIKNRPMVPLCA